MIAGPDLRPEPSCFECGVRTEACASRIGRIVRTEACASRIGRIVRTERCASRIGRIVRTTSRLEWGVRPEPGASGFERGGVAIDPDRTSLRDALHNRAGM